MTHYNKKSIKKETIDEMKEILDEWKHDYSEFGRKRGPYEIAVLTDMNNFKSSDDDACDEEEKANKKKNKAKKKRKKKKPKHKPSCSIIPIENDESFEDEIQRVQRLQNKNKNKNKNQGKNTNKNKNKNKNNNKNKNKNKNKNNNDKAEKEVSEVSDGDSSSAGISATSDEENNDIHLEALADFFEPFNDSANERFVFTKHDIKKINKVGITAGHLKQYLSNYQSTNVLVAMLSSVQPGKILEIQSYIMKNQTDAQPNNQSFHPSHAKENKRIPFEIAWTKRSQSLSQFNVLYQRPDVYVFPEIPGAMYYEKRYVVKLILIQSVLKYDHLANEYAKSRKNKNKKIHQNMCLDQSGAQMMNLKPHFLSIVVNEKKYNDHMGKVKPNYWLKKSCDALQKELFALNEKLDDKDKKEYIFSMDASFMQSFQSLYGNVWETITKLKAGVEKKKEKKRKANHNNNNHSDSDSSDDLGP